VEPVVVLVPASRPGFSSEATVVRYATASEVIAAVAAPGDVVLVSDGLGPADLDAVAAAIRGRPGQTIEVRSERWDGETVSPLSSVCRGVISGFGMAGVVRAVEVLRSR
jgi:hypothetical protein